MFPALRISDGRAHYIQATATARSGVRVTEQGRSGESRADRLGGGAGRLAVGSRRTGGAPPVHRGDVRACAAGRHRRAQPRGAVRRRASLWRFGGRPEQRRAPRSGSTTRTARRRLGLAAHDRRDRQRRHAVPGRFGDRRDQRAAAVEVRLVIHPILAVARDGPAACSGSIRRRGRACANILDADRDQPASPMPAAAMRWPTALGAVLADVRAAVDGLAADAAGACGRSTAELAAQPPPLPPTRLAEGADFLRWLDDDNFTFLGFRDYAVRRRRRRCRRPAARHPARRAIRVFERPARSRRRCRGDVQDFLRRRELLIIAKTDRRATVHRARDGRDRRQALRRRRRGRRRAPVPRPVHLARLQPQPAPIPLLRRKVRAHDASAPASRPTATTARRCCTSSTPIRATSCSRSPRTSSSTPRSASCTCRSGSASRCSCAATRFERFVSCLVFVPRDRYDTELRRAFRAILAEAFGGTVVGSTPHARRVGAGAACISSSGTTRGAVRRSMSQSSSAARRGGAHLGRPAASRRCRRRARRRARGATGCAGYGRPFPAAYQARTAPTQAIARHRADRGGAGAGSPLKPALHPRRRAATLRPASSIDAGEPVALSDVAADAREPGAAVIAEEPFRIDQRRDGVGRRGLDPRLRARWRPTADAGDRSRRRVSAAVSRRRFVAVWTGEVENDGFNRLVLRAGLDWRDDRRSCAPTASICARPAVTFSQAYMEETLARASRHRARLLVELFERRFDPARADEPATLDDRRQVAGDRPRARRGRRPRRGPHPAPLPAPDRSKSLRTNYLPDAADGEPKPYLSFKLASRELDLLPLPRPLCRDLRLQPAHGGRPSARRQGRARRHPLVRPARGFPHRDPRPDEGADGQERRHRAGRLEGRLRASSACRPARRASAIQAEGIACYKTLMRGLLDITDNMSLGDGESCRRRTSCAATATIPISSSPPTRAPRPSPTSPTASPREYGFWLGDAFASGGSAGYDHKEMGITARGAWEAVKRHFRELGTRHPDDRLHRASASATCRATCSATACCCRRTPS